MILLNDAATQRQSNYLSVPNSASGMAAPSTPLTGDSSAATPSAIVTISEEARFLVGDGPIIVRFRPTNGATGVSPLASIVLSFNRAIQRGIGDIVLRDALNNIVESFDAATSNRISIRDETLTVDPGDALAYDSAYSLEIGAGALKDLDGNGHAGFDDYNFRTKIDNDAPVVSRFRPSSGATTASPSEKISLTFNEAIQRGSGTITLKDGDGNTVETYDAATSSRISISGDKLTIRPGSDLDYDTEYTLEFAAGTVEDLNGNDFAGTNSYGFRTETDTYAPTVRRFRPASGSDGAAVDGRISLTFKEDIQRGSGNILLKDGDGNTVETYDAATSSRISISGDKLTIRPGSDLDYDTEYSLEFAAGTVADLNGNDFVGTNSYGFRTETDAYAPTVKRFRPASGSDGAAVGGRISLTFNEDVQRGSGNILLKDGDGNTVETYDAATSSRISISGDKLTIRPGSDLNYDTEYTLEFAAGTVEDLNGNDFVGTNSYGFRTENDTYAPTVKRFRPASGSDGAAVDGRISLTFNEDVQRGSGNILLKDGDGNTVETYDAATSSRISISGDKLTIRPGSDLDYDSEYTLEFATGTVADLNGNDFAGMNSYGFRTEVDVYAPTVTRFRPSDGATGVDVSANISLTFDEMIQRGSGSIILKDSDGNTVETYNAATSSRISISDKRLTINPTRNLAYDANYRVEFAAGTVRDLNGNDFGGTNTYDFRTVADPGGGSDPVPPPPPPPPPPGDTTAPSVVTFTPTDGSSTAQINANISLAFDEAIQRGSGAIVIKDGDGNTVESFDAATSNRISISNNTITIDPTSSLVNSTQYSVTFASGTVKDLAGNSFAGTNTYDFTTAHSDFNIEIDYSGDVQYGAYFTQAVATWEKIIIGDLSAVGAVDDLKITAAVNAIDGVGGILGSAGPTNLRGDNHLTYLGQMQFDSADMAGMAASGILQDVITHEMGHVLGIGTLWGMFGFNTNFGEYTGTEALGVYRELSGISGATYVPLEDGGGPGTENVHWEESIFNRELMTGYAEGAPPMPLSKLSIAALDDLGYTVNYAAAQSYSLPSLVTRSTVDVRV